MNYGYDAGSMNWKESKKEELALALHKLLSFNSYPEVYIEVDSLYPGVRLRKITNLSDKEREKLIKEADKIYAKVMVSKNH